MGSAHFVLISWVVPANCVEDSVVSRVYLLSL